MKIYIFNLKESDMAIDNLPDKKLLEFVKSAFEYKGGYTVEIDN